MSYGQRKKEREGTGRLTPREQGRRTAGAGGTEGGRLKEGFAKISRPPAAAAYRNEERREREVAATERTRGGPEMEGARTDERGGEGPAMGRWRAGEATKVEEEA